MRPSEIEKWKKCALFLGIMLGATFNAFCPSSTFADVVVLDQEVDAFGSSNPDGPLGGPSIGESQYVLQTFTAAVGGTLDAIDVQVQHGPEGTPTNALVLTIRNTLSNGEPDRTQELGSVSLPASSFPVFNNFTSGPFTSFDVRELDIRVNSGDVLAIELSSATNFQNSYFIFESQTDIYAGGGAFIFSPADGAFFGLNRDVGFRTFVAIPEPAPGMFIGLTILLTIVYCRFR